jgi:hypothetical protein
VFAFVCIVAIENSHVPLSKCVFSTDARRNPSNLNQHIYHAHPLSEAREFYDHKTLGQRRGQQFLPKKLLPFPWPFQIAIPRSTVHQLLTILSV